jgi:hypothetical protein
MLIYEVEDKIIEYYKTIQFESEFKKKLETVLLTEMKEKKKLSATEQNELREQKAKLERIQGKLMEAYYASAINQDVLKVEQDKIASQLDSIKMKLEVAEHNYDITAQNLKSALELVGNCYESYKQAPDHIRRMLNRAFFEKIYVSPDTDNPEQAKISTELRAPFAQILATKISPKREIFQTILGLFTPLV